VTFQDINSPSWMEKEGAKKIKLASEQARKEDLEFVWVDTCCIDKASSAELSEAINSMFSWYENASICYAYLEDVFIGDSPDSIPNIELKIENSKWFTRGWTLQELIAPIKVHFFDKHWVEIGNKSNLLDLLSRVTTIPTDVLTNPSNRRASSAARKMSWAAKRNTTRVEDSAYCLLGIFGVNMPLLYGEGKKAFIRLQEEILKETDDHSLLAWESDPHSDFVGVLADSADGFLAFANVVPFLRRDTRGQPCLMTGRGLRIDVQLTLVMEGRWGRGRIAILDCYRENMLSDVLALVLLNVESNIYVREPGRGSIGQCRPQFTEKETIFILKNAPQKFSGTVYRVHWTSAEDLGFQITEVLPKKFSWDPTTSSIRFSDGPSQSSWVSFIFKNAQGFGFIVAHYIKGCEGDNQQHDHCLWIYPEYSSVELEKWLESNREATNLGTETKRLSLNLPRQIGYRTSLIVDASIKEHDRRNETFENIWELTVAMKWDGKKPTPGLLLGWMRKDPGNEKY